MGNYRARYRGNCLFLSDDITIIASDTSDVYAPDTVRVSSDDIVYERMEDVDGWTVNTYYSLDADFQLKKK